MKTSNGTKAIISKFYELKKFALNNKKFSAVMLVIILFSVYSLSKSTSTSTQTRYIIATAEKTTVESFVTGSGQISTSDQVDIQPEVSGTVNYVAVKIGDSVKKGDIIVALDSTDAKQAVQNADLSLSNAKIAYDKALKKYDDQAINSPVSDLNQACEDGYKTIANTFIDLPDISLGMDSIFYDPAHSPYFSDILARSYAGDLAITYKYQAGIIFDKFKKDYDSAFNAYRNIPPGDHTDITVSALDQTYNLLKELSLSLNGTYNTIDYINQRISEDKPAQIATDKTSLSSYINKVNNDLSSVQSAITNIENAKDSATTAQLDLKSAELSVNQAQENYKNAQIDLANNTIRAPFDGTVAKISIENGDKVTTSSSIATIITKEKVAEIDLNEIDISKIKVGQKVTLTFDAIDGLTATGGVTEVDLLGTVSQGVVNYTVKVHLDTQDDRIKSGMTVSASIVNETLQNVVAIPNSAIKTQGNNSFVQVPDSSLNLTNSKGPVTLPTAPKSVKVTLGLSNDDVTEILSGLSAGDKYIAQTIQPSAGITSTTQAPSLFGGGSGGGTRSATGSANTGAFLRATR
ncbi:MAG: efflux RND transporter periplasmic adaptor subunit [Candidatus Zambryskibacteria bacterium]